MKDQAKSTPLLQARLGMWDAVSIIVGIVIGSSIYKTPPIIFNNVEGPWSGLGVWALCGVLSLVGALCYAELASTYPRAGGDYVYLTRAYGSLVGFLFGWAQLAVILTSSTGMMAFIFGEYAIQLWDIGPSLGLQTPAATIFVYAFAAVAVLSALNILGVVLGKWTQNLLSLAKVLGLGGIVVAGLGWGQPGAWTVTKTVTPDYATAIILVLYAYGGWNDAAFVASECRERRTIVRALIVGTILITVVYLAVNFAYIQALTFQGVRDSNAVAAATLARPLGETGAKAMSLLVMISALGAINGLIYTGSRVYASMGADHSVFALLGRWHPQLGSPLWSLLVQAVISLAFIVSVGTAAGRDGINSVLNGIGIPAIPWDKYFGGFDTLFAGTAPVFWSFFLLTGLSVFILRWRDPGIERPFRVPLYPLLPLIFCATCVFGIYAAGKYAGWVVLLGVVPLVVGLPLYFVSTKRGSPAEPTTPAAHAGA